MTNSEFNSFIGKITNELNVVIPGNYKGGFEKFQKDYKKQGITISYGVGEVSKHGEFTISATDDEGFPLLRTLTLS